MLVLLLVSFLFSNSYAQFTWDSLVFEQQKYGMVSYFVPTNMVTSYNICCPELPPQYDTLCTCYTDSMFVLVRIDSIDIDPELAAEFSMTQITRGIWIGPFVYSDTGTEIQSSYSICDSQEIVDTFYIAKKVMEGIAVYIKAYIMSPDTAIWGPTGGGK